MKQTQCLIEVYRIVEYKNGDVFKTEYVEDRWVPIVWECPDGFTFAPKSNDYMGQTLRTVEVEPEGSGTPDTQAQL